MANFKRLENKSDRDLLYALFDAALDALPQIAVIFFTGWSAWLSSDIAQNTPWTPNRLAFCYGLCCIAVFSCFELFLKKRMSQLKAQNIKATNVIDAAQALPAILFETLLYSQFEALRMKKSCRISLYELDTNIFVCVGRWAEVPAFKEQGRKTFPPDDGCIGKVYQSPTGIFYQNNLPSPIKQLEEYVSRSVSLCGIDETACRNLKMKSRSYCAVIVKLGSERIAVIVLESTEAGGVTREMGKQLLDGDFSAKLSAIMTKTKNLRSSLSEASTVTDKLAKVGAK